MRTITINEGSSSSKKELISLVQDAQNNVVANVKEIVVPVPPGPVPGNARNLIFPSTSGSLADSLLPGQSKYYYFTVPSTFSKYIVANMDSRTQQGGLQIMLMKNSMTNIDKYFSDALAWYNADPVHRGGAHFFIHPEGTCWIVFGGAGVNAGVKVYQSTANPVGPGPQAVAGIPGTYFLLAHNSNTTQTNSFFIYAQGQ
jgi:hypothetical protein